MIAQMLQKNCVCLDLPAALKYLDIVSSCLDGILAQETDLEEHDRVSYDVQLAVQEICANIVCHAYIHEQEDKRIHIKIMLQAQPRCLVIDQFDTGAAFDECKVKMPNLEEGQVHGYGLFLVKNLMDDVLYCRQINGNCWHLAKNL